MANWQLISETGVACYLLINGGGIRKDDNGQGELGEQERKIDACCCAEHASRPVARSSKGKGVGGKKEAPEEQK